MRGGVFIVLLGATLSLWGCAKGDLASGSSPTPFGGGGSSNSNGATSEGAETDTPDTDRGNGEVGGEGCGDGVAEGPEHCDGEDLKGETCESRGFAGGELRCSASCTFDTSQCIDDTCGDGTLDDGEECDGLELGGAECTDVGYAGGDLACAPDCTFDTSGCLEAVCGDGVVGGDEACDCGQTGDGCTEAQLSGESCTSLPAPSGGNYSGGTLACNSPESCTFDESGCTWCGNGTVDPGEQCDGNDLAGATCSSQGFDTGTLGCTSTCTFDTSNCANYVCGNGTCDPGEDECNCPQDCPNDPNSCASCQCGGNAGNCWCDQACINLGDCCFNGPC